MAYNTTIMNKKIILVVEDEKALNEALCTKLINSGFEVDSTTNGKECLGYLNKKIPHLIVLDLMMPIMDGIEVIKHLKSEPKTSTIPVLVLTNSSDVEKISEVLVSGVHDYLIKSENSLEYIIDLIKNRLI
jgi:DNA-binding response OmpR family regulator